METGVIVTPTLALHTKNVCKFKIDFNLFNICRLLFFPVLRFNLRICVRIRIHIRLWRQVFVVIHGRIYKGQHGYRHFQSRLHLHHHHHHHPLHRRLIPFVIIIIIICLSPSNKRASKKKLRKMKAIANWEAALKQWLGRKETRPKELVLTQVTWYDNPIKHSDIH